MIKLTYQDPKKNDWFLVSWTLGNKCNYRCSYCPDFLHNGNPGWPSWDSVSNFIKNFNQPGKDVCYRISGGEPTYWKHFIDMAKMVKDKNQYFSFLTNGSQTVDYYQKISNYSDGIIFSFHHEYADVSHFVDIVKEVPGIKGINIMVTPENLDKSFKIAETLFSSADNIAIWPKVILDKDSNSYTNNPGEFNQEQKQLLKNWPFLRNLPDQKIHRGIMLMDDKEISGNDLILKGLNKFQGWKCWGGLHGLCINYRGEVYRSDCEYGGSLGTIDNYSIPSEPIICGKDKCVCLSDIYLMKIKD